jgi:hypothetical protein
MSQRLILLTVPPPATLRDQDAADLEMLVAALKWRESAELTGPDEFGQLSGNRWHVVLRQFLDETTSTKKKVGAAELEYLVNIVKRDGTKKHGTTASGRTSWVGSSATTMRFTQDGQSKMCEIGCCRSITGSCDASVLISPRTTVRKASR